MRSIAQSTISSMAVAALLVFASAVVMPLGVYAATDDVASPPPPTPPKNCKLVGDATCGRIEFSCDPFSEADTITLPLSSENISVVVTNVQANVGLILGKFFTAGEASVTVCAARSGVKACGLIGNVTFKQTGCTGGGGGEPSRSCPTGEEFCQGACAPFGSPQCDRHQ